MTTKKKILSISFIVFPAALFLVYWAKIYTNGQEFRSAIPGLTAFATLGVMFILERIFHYKKGVSQKPLALRDLSSTLMNVLVTGKVLGAMVYTPLVLFLPEIMFGRSLFFATPADLGPFWLQLFLVLMVYSFFRYSVHRIQHIIPFLWELHSYHHGVTDLKASNTYVSHPVDFSLRNVLPPVALGFIGFDPMAIVISAGLLNTASTFSHCGAGLHAGPILNYFFVTPEVHRWHHSAKVPEGHKFSVNYGVGFAIWDRIFGTFYLPVEDGIPVQPDRLGHPSGYKDEGNYFKLFFLWRYMPKFMRPKEG
ncbi:MAG: sterol desaturase family protein [Kordiimonadaceae bacterium]|jgi:ornithine lipid hydroxylase|nr:sterol desaturase family protein [Kordiimonadaceae bacterium]MBT6035199.1 sterol desaturase family protein [Kordiimonadaceae bacterium]MBT6329346.1 sterol desaturase family protein [Kordiimonadaceae bacterium]MBT7582473.1 sterol desaturase family protein [Kordiimonadaceae bacterium]